MDTKELLQKINQAWEKLKLDEKSARLSEVEQQLSDAEIWQLPEQAQQLVAEQNALKNFLTPWKNLRQEVEALEEVPELADQAALEQAEQSYKKLEQDLWFTGEYDSLNVILRLTAGAGGDDAQDWTEMLERMYLRWAEQNEMKAKVIDRTEGTTAGIKTSVIEISGVFAYGKLRGENGVHRLVRLSPFNAESRETSFARVEVLPQISAQNDIELQDKDLRIDYYRSSGHGGQSVNTTDSAVRITHLPTGITVSIQNEKSQIKNKEEAMKILKGKLVALQMEQHAEKLSDLKGESQSAAWGQQIRNYVLHPYKIVKSILTKYEESDPDKVLDGKINGFIQNYLENQTDL